jgi:hypothetical protein
MTSGPVHWEHSIQHDPQVKLDDIEHFSARDMHRVYGRADHIDKRTLNLDLWKTKDGRVLARFWSRSQEVDPESWEVIGQPDVGPPGEQWVPLCLRQRYESWVTSNV